MKLQNVPIDQIAWNPYRDMEVYPIDADHVDKLRKSIVQHDFFGGIKGRRHNGKIEIACGHHRIEAARKEKHETVPIFVDEMTDDEMVALMATENATQGGYSAAAVNNDVAAAMRRLITILLGTTDHFASNVAKWFEGKKGFEIARGKLLARIDDPDRDGGLGWPLILRYLGNGNEIKSPHSKKQVIEAIATLKQSGRYDDIVDTEISKYELPLPETRRRKSEPSAAVATKKPRPPRAYDDRCASVFPNETQAKAFREAVTTEAAKRFIPVNQQLPLARKIMDPKQHKEFDKKQTGAPYIKTQVHAVIDLASRKQREIDAAEREAFAAAQREERIDAELHSVNASIRSLHSGLARMRDLAMQNPGHPKIGGFVVKLEQLAAAIDTFLTYTMKAKGKK